MFNKIDKFLKGLIMKKREKVYIIKLEMKKKILEQVFWIVSYNICVL